MTPTHRRLALTLLALWVAAVAYLTLTPSGYTPPVTLRGFLCVGCGILDGADLVRNWLLFLPGGLLAGLILPPLRATLAFVFLTAVIETLQIGIPGRDPGLQDLLLNTLGGVTGLTVVTRGLSPNSARALLATGMLCWLAPFPLLVPQGTPHDQYGLWTPRFGNRVQYEGRVLAASLGSVAIESRIIPQRDAVVMEFVNREALVLWLEVGPAPRGALAPIFQIKDAERQDLLELGALHSDLILRGRNLARVLKLDQPDVRWHNAMAGLSPGDTVTLVVERGRGSVCMSIDDREECNLAPSLADGWGFVLNLEGPPRWFRELMSLGWAMGLGGLMGLATAGWRRAIAFSAGTAVVGYLAATSSPDVRPDMIHAAMLVVGAGLGAVLRTPVIELWRAVRPT